MRERKGLRSDYYNQGSSYSRCSLFFPIFILRTSSNWYLFMLSSNFLPPSLNIFIYSILDVKLSNLWHDISDNLKLLRSGVNFIWGTFPYHFCPFSLFWICFFAFPVNFSLIGIRRWTLLDYYLFVMAKIWKSCITSEPIFNSLFFDFLYWWKWSIILMQRLVCCWCRHFRLSHRHDFLLFTMLFCPKFPITDTFMKFLNLIVRITVPSSRYFVC